MKKILDDVYNLGMIDGMGGYRCIRTLSLINDLSDLIPVFDRTEGYDLLAEYEDGWQQGKFARDKSLLKKEEFDV